MTMKYPPYLLSSETKVPVNRLMICDKCHYGNWYLQSMVIHYCSGCRGRMRDGTREEYSDAKRYAETSDIRAPRRE